VRFTGSNIDDVIDEEDALLKDIALSEGTVATYSCERGFELLGPTRRECQANGIWIPEGVPFCGKFHADHPISISNIRSSKKEIASELIREFVNN
jgi:hypothetical protein